MCKKITIFIFLLIAIEVKAFSLLPFSIPGIEAFCCDSSETRMIISISDGGLWKTDDAGATWVSLNELIVSDDELKFYGCNELFTIDVRCDTIFAKLDFIRGPLHEYAYSFDGGDSWQHLRINDEPLFGYGNFLRVDQNNSNRFYYVDAYKIRISEDFYHSWESYIHDQYMCQVFNFKQAPQNDSTLFIASVAVSDIQPGGVFHSQDGGVTWEPLIYPEELIGYTFLMVDDVIPLSNGEVLAFPTLGENSDGINEYLFSILRSTDNGESWSLESDIFSHFFKFHSAMEIPGFPGTILAISYPANNRFGILKSTDYGHSFVSIEESCPEMNGPSSSMWFNKFNNNIYVCQLENGVFKSQDGGDTWTRIQGLPDILGHKSYYSLTESRIYLKDQFRNNLYSFSFETMSWDEYPEYCNPVDSVFDVTPILFENEDELISIEHTYHNNNINSVLNMRRSTDNGSSWTSYGETLSSTFCVLNNENNPITYSSANKSRIIVNRMDASGAVYTGCSVSIDTGRTWRNCQLSTPANTMPMYAQNDSTIFMSISGIGLSKSNDDGASWTNLNMPNNVNWQYFTPVKYNVSGNCLYVFTGNSVLTFDGQSWQTIGNFNQWPFTVAMVPDDVPKFFFTSIDNRITASLDGGYTWFLLNIDTQYFEQLSTIGDIKYDPWRDRIWVMTGLGPMYVQVEDVSDVTDKPVQLYPVDYELLTAYPNPFNENSRIIFSLLKSDQIKLEIFDITGRRVKTLASGEYQSGKHEVFLDASRLASGTYFLKLNTTDGIRTHKVTLVK